MGEEQEAADDAQALIEYKQVEDATLHDSEASLANMQRLFSIASFQAPLIPDMQGIEFNRMLRRYLDHQHTASKRLRMHAGDWAPPRLALPYDRNRVTLDPIKRPEFYINASWLTCPPSAPQAAKAACPCFLATQTPHELARADWWQMVWDHDVSVIAVVRRLRDWDREAYWTGPPGSTVDLRSQEKHAMCRVRKAIDAEVRAEVSARHEALVGPLLGFLKDLGSTALHPREFERSLAAFLAAIEKEGAIEGSQVYFSHNSVAHIISGSQGARSYVRAYFEHNTVDPQLRDDVAELGAALQAERLKETERLATSRQVFEYLQTHRSAGPPLTLTYDDMRKDGLIALRHFTLDNGRATRRITQLMLDWPGNSVVPIPLFLDYLGQVKAAVAEAPTGSPLLVHCAAGIGRTGTFVTLYLASLARHLASLDKVVMPRIKAIVIYLRTLRPSLVETAQQYAMILKTLRFMN